VLILYISYYYSKSKFDCWILYIWRFIIFGKCASVTLSNNDETTTLPYPTLPYPTLTQPTVIIANFSTLWSYPSFFSSYIIPSFVISHPCYCYCSLHDTLIHIFLLRPSSVRPPFSFFCLKNNIYLCQKNLTNVEARTLHDILLLYDY